MRGGRRRRPGAAPARAAALPLALALGLAFASPIAAAEPVDVGFVVDGPWERNDELIGLVKGEILALTEGEFEIRFPPPAVADWSTVGVRQAADRLLADPEIDLVIAMGTLASHTFCCRGELPKPVIAPLILDPELQGLPPGGDPGRGSGVPNLSYVAFPDGFAHDVAELRRIAPFEHLVILASRPLLETIPALRLDDAAQSRLLGLRVSRVEVEGSVDAALAAIPADADAVYLPPLRHLSGDDYDRLIAGLAERRLASFAVLGAPEVRRGVLMGLTPDSFFDRLARRIALNVQRILLGEAPSEIPVAFPRRDRLIVNLRTARAIGLSPPWEVLLEAELVHPLPEAAETLTLEQAVDEAVAANLDLAARRRQVAAGAYDVAAARSNLLPRLDLSALGVAIDSDRAEASLGQQAERTLSTGLDLAQLLWSDAAWAGLDVERHLQAARLADLARLRLDVASEAAVAYLNVLRAGSLERVRRNDVALTRRNLELARVRREVGTAGAIEVHRWEAEIATARRDLLVAAADRRIAETVLARLLHRSLDAELGYTDLDASAPGLLSGEERFTRLIRTPASYATFVDFMVAEGLAAAPELERLDAAIAAQERAATAARRAFHSPTVVLAAQVDRILERGGAGSEGGSLFAGLPPLPRPDDTDWSLAVSATLPLFTGGSRIAEKLQADEELARLRLEREALAERLETRIRISHEAARGSHPGIALSRRAAASAQQTLDLVSDAYARGAVSLLDLLDAQNTALNAEELAANAVYDFLIDLVEAERAVNRFDFFLSPEERADWYRRLENHFLEHGSDWRAGPGGGMP